MSRRAVAKFTFKKEQRGVCHPYPDTQIKHNKKQVGYISAPDWNSTEDVWSVRLMVCKDNRWQWITLKTKFDTESEAREYLTKNAERLIALGLHHMDE